MKALVTRRSPLSSWLGPEAVDDRLGRMFGSSFPRFFIEEPAEWIPAVNLIEADGEYLLTAELPGLDLNDVQVEVEDGFLTVRGKKQNEVEEEKEGRWHMLERSYGAFERSFALPRAVDPDRVVAEAANGILTVHMPKREETAGRRIDIKTTKK